MHDYDDVERDPRSRVCSQIPSYLRIFTLIQLTKNYVTDNLSKECILNWEVSFNLSLP